MVDRRVEEAAGRVGEALEDGVSQAAGEREPAGVEGRFVQGEEAFGEVGVVLEHAGPDRSTVLPGSLEVERAEGGCRGRGRARCRCRGRRTSGQEPADDRAGGAFGGGRVVGSVEEAAGLGERGDRQAVPGGQGLVIAGGLGPRSPTLQQPCPRIRE